MSKFNKGDTVRVIGFGELAGKDAGCVSCGHSNEGQDVMPQIVGRIGVIENVVQANGYTLYELSGIPEKKLWYLEEQLTIA